MKFFFSFRGWLCYIRMLWSFRKWNFRGGSRLLEDFEVKKLFIVI